VASTYTTQFFNVSNGDITTHNPQSLVPTTKDILIQSAEVQWEGVNNGPNVIESFSYDSKSEFTNEYNTFEGVDANIAVGSTEVFLSNDAQITRKSYTLRHTPPISFDYRVSQGDTVGSLISIDFALQDDTTFPTSQRFTIAHAADGTGQSNGNFVLSRLEDIDGDGEVELTHQDEVINVAHGGSSRAKVTKINADVVEVELIDPDTNTVKQTARISDTSTDLRLPEGTYHVNGDASDSGLTTTVSQVGTSGNTVNPRVTRDVSASLTANISDGQQSVYTTLSGLDPNRQEFYHDIDGGGEARFRFRFDYREKYPDALKELRVYDGDANAYRKVALANPTDSLLDYNAVRTEVNGTTYAVDVVVPSDTDAITSHRLYHPTHGVLCPRAFDTV